MKLNGWQRAAIHRYLDEAAERHGEAGDHVARPWDSDEDLIRIGLFVMLIERGEVGRIRQDQLAAVLQGITERACEEWGLEPFETERLLDQVYRTQSRFMAGEIHPGQGKTWR